MKKSLFLILVFILAGCGSLKNKDLESAARIYIDNMLIDEQYAGKPDSIKIFRNKVFAKYNMKEEEYKKFFENLSIDKKKWDSFFDSAEKYLDSLKTGNKIK